MVSSRRHRPSRSPASGMVVVVVEVVAAGGYP